MTLIVVLAAMVIAAPTASASSFQWNFDGRGNSYWTSREVYHNYSYASAFDGGCLAEVLPVCTNDYLLGSRLRRHEGDAVYGGEVYGYPRADRHYAGDTGTYHQAQSTQGATDTAYEEW